MRKAHYLLGLALFVGVSLCLLPVLRAADSPVADSPEVTELLAQAKTHSARLTEDADLMHKFSMMQVSWESHSDQISMIKEHANDLGKVLQKMSDRQQWASQWQQQAIDRITPLAVELASNIQSTIEHINQNQNRLHTPEYKEFLTANYELSSSLSKLISDYVSYGKSKAKFQQLGTTLESPSK